MASTFRFAEFLRATGSTRQEISIGQLYPSAERDQHGRIVRVAPVLTRVSSREVAALLRPYVSTRFMEQCRAVVPLAVYLALFQLLILRERFEDSCSSPAACLPSSPA